ncbi:MAG: mannose-1-phosphate guanylyltransferase, partial [Bradymonadaceae bacterium]
MIAVVLAGGSGTRFWPLSRKARPKQLIRLFGDRPMIGETVSRLSPFISATKTLIVSGESLADPTRAALPELDAESFIFEPCARNTAPAIGLAAIYARARFGDEVMGVFPSDHFIGDVPAFIACLVLAEKVASQGSIVTLGITPTRPETGFGYIRFDPAEPLAEAKDRKAFAVDAFVEKPDRPTAEGYLARGGYVWNSGMFVFRPSVLMAEMKRQ